MCVDTSHQAWERPATKADCAIIAKHFDGVDFEELLDVMSEDGARPLTTDLVLVGAMVHTQPDARGMRKIPFSAIETHMSQNIIKLPVMDKIVEWYENSALGTDIWNNASDWCEEKFGARIHFVMNCSCGMVSTKSYLNGEWTAWKRDFNTSRAHLYGRTTVVRRDANNLTGLDLSPAQLMMWQRMRACLEALPAEQLDTDKLAA